MTERHLRRSRPAVQAHDLSSCAGLNHSSVQQATIVTSESTTLSTMVDYANRLDAAIKNAKSSASQLSAELGISYQAIKKVLDGKSTALNAENHMRAARFLGVNSFWLATGEEQMQEQPPAAPPIPIANYKVTESETASANYNWPFKSVSLANVKQLPERKLGQIEGYMNRIIEEESLNKSNGTNHNKSQR